VENYRVIYVIEEEIVTVEVMKVKYRKEVY